MIAHPINLIASPEGWRLFTIRKADPSFRKFEQKIWKRDNYTCQFCGFQAKRHQEIVNLDQNYANNKIENLVTACCFCTQCFFLDAVGKNDYGGGTLIFLPELSQNDLDGLCHVLFCAMANATAYQSDAHNIYRSLSIRSKMVDKAFGEGMSNPSLLGKMLVDGTTLDLQTKDKIVTNLRLLPMRDKFSIQIADWADDALKELSA